MKKRGARKQNDAEKTTTVVRPMIADRRMIVVHRMIAVHPTIVALLTIAVRPTIAALLTIVAHRMIVALPTIAALLTIAAHPMIAVHRMIVAHRMIAAGRTMLRAVDPATDRSDSRRAPAALLTLALLLAVNGPAHAYSDEAAQQFRLGSTAFQAGEYEKALGAFEQAVAAGMSGPAVHFNIGVAAYRAGKYPRAELAFNEAARTPAMAGIAYYNLGLIELARNHRDAAATWFARAEQSSNDAKLRELAASQLADLRPAAPREIPWAGFAAFGLGYDDNVALVSNSQVLGISDSKDAFAEAQLWISTPSSDGWRMDGSVVLVNYQDLDAYDQLSINAGARYRWSNDTWTSDLGARMGYSAIDGAGFENRRTLSLQTSRYLGRELRVRGRYNYHHLDGLNDFENLGGRRQDAGTRLDWSPTHWNIGAEYRFELVDYDDETLSSKRHRLRLDVERELAAHWSVLFEAIRRRSDYDSDLYGSENRTELALSVSRALSARWRVVARYSYTDNTAVSREFDYRGNRISAGVEATL